MKRKPFGALQRIAFEIDGTATRENVQTVVDHLQSACDKYDKVDLLVRIKTYSFDPEILTMQSLLSGKMASLNHVRRYAIVGAFKPLVDIEIRTFDLDEEDQAWAWLKA